MPGRRRPPGPAVPGSWAPGAAATSASRIPPSQEGMRGMLFPIPRNIRSFRQGQDQVLEYPPPLLEVLEAVEGGAGRREDHHVPRLGQAVRRGHGGGVVLRLQDGDVLEVLRLLGGTANGP